MSCVCQRQGNARIPLIQSAVVFGLLERVLQLEDVRAQQAKVRVEDVFLRNVTYAFQTMPDLVPWRQDDPVSDGTVEICDAVLSEPFQARPPIGRSPAAPVMNFQKPN